MLHQLVVLEFLVEGLGAEVDEPSEKKMKAAK
jgi:hypothetical protein